MRRVNTEAVAAFLMLIGPRPWAQYCQKIGIWYAWY